MSNDFWSTLNKKKREELLKTAQTKASSSNREEITTGDFWSVLNEDKKRELLGATTEVAPTRTFMQDDDDIAPVKGGNKNSVFKSGGFSDGVDGVGDFFGDLGQTVLGTTADLGLGILKGAGRLVEGVVDLGTYGVAGVADLFGADKFAEKTKKVAQYSATDEWTKGATDYVDQYSVLGNKADMVSEGIGQVGAIILTGGAAGAAGLGTAGATALTTGLTGLSGMGSGMNEAYEMGASDGSAVAYGATVGTLEAVSEMIFGGLGKGVKALGISKGLTSIDDIAARKLSNAAAKFITSEAGQKVVGNTLEYAVKSGAEGLEEVISGFGSAIAKDAYLMNGEDEKAFGEILEDENLLEQFVVGSIVSGIAQGGDFISSTKNGRDFVSGLSKNEQTVVDKVYEQRLAEESENRTLSNRDKNKLYERVAEEMKRGYVTTDEIESILGGETYKGYKDLADKKNSLEERKKAIEEEIKSLVKTPESQFTIEQREKLTSLREEAKGIKESLQNLGIKTAKNNLFNEVNKLTAKDTFLRESYNDLERQKQALQIDENQYNGTKFADAAKKTIENARKAKASNSIRVRDFVEFSAKYSSVSGTVVDFKDADQINKILEDQLNAKITTLQKSTAAEDKEKLAQIQDMLKQVQEGKIHVNGVKTKDGVAINLKSPNYLNVVLGHEVTHFLEGKNAYEPLQKAIFKYAQHKGDLDGRRSVLEALYENIDGTSVDYELTADLVGEYLFTEYDFIKNLSTEDRNVFQKVYDQIKYMFKLATAGSKEARELEKVMHQFEKALRESAEVSQNTQYQLSKDIDKNADLGYNGNEMYTVSDRFVLEVDKNDRDVFARSLANKTADLKQDEIRTVEIYSDKKVYFFKATGYMQGQVLKSVSTDDRDGFIKARKVYINEINGSSETFDSWIDAFSAYRKGAGSDISDFGIGQGKNDSDGIYGRASERNGTGTQERSGENFRDDPEEVKSIIAELHKEYGITENYSTNEIAPIKEVSSTDDAFFDGEKRQFSLYASEETSNKQKQFEIIQETNPMWDDYHTGIRSTDDIRTWAEVLELNDESEGQFVWGDFSRTDAEQALKDGTITVYSSYPIKNGVFVSTSYIQAQEYAGGKNGKVYSKTIPLTDVAWINGDEGQYAKVDASYSLSQQGEKRTLGGSYRFDGKDFRTPANETALEQDIAPVAEGVAKNATNTNATAPKSTRIADGTRGDELLAESLDNYPIQTIEQKVAEKIRATEGELTDNRDLRKEAEANYESQIAKLRAEYNSKKNKETKVAYGLLQSISRLERLKASTDAQFAKRISDLEARVEKMKEPKYTRAMRRRAKMAEHAKFAEDLLGNTSTWVDKKLGLQYATNTERRNLRDIVRDENGNIDVARADAINDALNGQYNREEADRQRELAQVRKKYADLKITKAEDEYIQMLGELRHNPETELSPQTVNEFLEKNKDKIDEAKVDKVIELARRDYDDFIIRVNEALREQGMREIPYRQGYFPHFVNPKQNFIQRLLNWKTQDNEIPTSIAGLTEEFKPVKSWQSFDKKRHGDKTDYSFMKGFDAYSNGVLDWIYHLDTIQKRRAVENHIRSTHSDEGITKRIKEVYANEEYDANEAQAQIEQILAEANNPLNNFVQDFMTHTNILTNKKNSLDRTTEQMTNRKIYSVMQNVQNRTSANMVLANVRSALTNFIPITQSWAQVSPLRSLQATKDTIANAIKDDGLINKSTFLTNRLREADSLYKTNWDVVLDKAGIMFEIVDNFSSQVIWRSKYNQNLDNGMSEAEAIANADQFAENVMAGRSKGNEPTLFNAKNPIVKAFTMFQLEVNNQYGYLFKDVPNDLKAETNHWKLNLAKGYTTAFIGAYVYNALLEKVAGSGAALDPIGIIEDLLRDLGLFDDDEEKEPDEVITNLIENVGGELPFVGGTLFGGGRIPISSALPYGDDGLVSGVGDFVTDVTEGNWKNIGKEMMNPILNVGLPVGGGQLKKTVQGLKMFSDEHPVSGSYTDSGNLRFPVEDTLGNRVQAALFGQYASKNAREYFDNDYAPLKEKQIQEYMDVDMPIADYWKYREGLGGLKTNAEKADYINSLDIADWQKNLLMNNILDRKEDVDMSNYDDYSDWEEFDYAQKNPDKYAFAKSVGGYSAYKTYSDELYDIKADKDEYGKSISGSRKEKVLNYINNLDADYETKIILWKSEYPSDDTYNMDIINYLNNRADLTYEERVAILTELGFTVSGDTVYWD